MSDPEFVLLKEGVGWIEEKYLWDTLGAVVMNYLEPGEDFIPKNTLRFSNGLDEATLDKFWLTKEKGKKKDNTFEVPGWFKISGRKSEMKSFDLQGKRITAKRLRARPQFWKAMNLKEPEIASKVDQWRSSKKDFLGRPKEKAFWITGVLLCQNVFIAASDKEARELEIRGEINLGTCAELAMQAGLGIPIPSDLINLPSVVGKRSQVTADSQCYGGRMKDTYIFGLQLEEVVPNGKKGSKELRTKKADLKQHDGRMLDDSDSEDETYETRALDEEAWTLLLAEEDNQEKEQEEKQKEKQEEKQEKDQI